METFKGKEPTASKEPQAVGTKGVWPRAHMSHSPWSWWALKFLPYLKHVINEVDESPEEQGRAVGGIVLHCLVCQPEKQSKAYP